MSSISFYDLDGVVIYSAGECFVTSAKVYYGFCDDKSEFAEIQSLFLRHRGLVGPASRYLCLHRAIEQFLSGSASDIADAFLDIEKKTEVKELAMFEESMFALRRAWINCDLQSWAALNPLTEFGRYLQKCDGSATYILTTKDATSAATILDFYKISYAKVFAASDVADAGSKGRLIVEYLDRERIDRTVFLDDSPDHLDTAVDPRINCYFADWGYGVNRGYRIFTY